MNRSRESLAPVFLAVLAGLLGAGGASAGPIAALPPQNPILPDGQGTTCALGAYNLADQRPLDSNGFFADVSCDQTGGSLTVADNFIAPEDVEVTAIHVWGGYFPGNTPTQDQFRFLIHEDAGGLPGNTLHSETQASVTRSQTGRGLYGVDEWLYSFDLPSPILLPAGTYWLEVFNDTGFGGDDWFWERGQYWNSIQLSASANQSPGVEWTSSELELSMVICGRPLVPPSTTYCDERESPGNYADIAIDGVTLEPGRTVSLSGASPNETVCLLVGAQTGVQSLPYESVGSLCLAGGERLGRYALDVGRTDATGRFEVDISSSASGGPGFGLPLPGRSIRPGETWSFQYWFRRPGGQPASFSSAVSVTFR